MISMRTLLSTSPFLPPDAQRAVAEGHFEAYAKLVSFGLSDWEATELLDKRDVRARAEDCSCVFC
jgi:hypothetical protein